MCVCVCVCVCVGDLSYFMALHYAQGSVILYIFITVLQIIHLFKEIYLFVLERLGTKIWVLVCFLLLECHFFQVSSSERVGKDMGVYWHVCIYFYM